MPTAYCLVATSSASSELSALCVWSRALQQLPRVEVTLVLSWLDCVQSQSALVRTTSQSPPDMSRTTLHVRVPAPLPLRSYSPQQQARAAHVGHADLGGLSLKPLVNQRQQTCLQIKHGHE